MLRQFILILDHLKILEDMVPSKYRACLTFELLDVQPSIIPVPESLPNNSIQPTIAPNTAATSTTSTTSTTKGPTRQNFKFTAKQKQILTEQFNAGLHYPTNAEKDTLAQMFSVPSDSVFLHPKFVLADVRYHAGSNACAKKRGFKRHENQPTLKSPTCPSTFPSNHCNIDQKNVHLQPSSPTTDNSRQRTPTTR